MGICFSILLSTVNAMHSCFFYYGRLLPKCVVLWLLTGLLGLGVSSADEKNLIDPAQPSVAAPYFGANKSTDMTNSAIGRAPTEIKVANPVLYYANRTKAIELAKNQNWQEAKPLLQTLTTEFRDDGDTWFALGLTYLGLEQWPEAIEALENALALGTRLFGMPGGGANPNDMMIRLAEAYGQMGDEERAIHWINQALNARWDDRPKLAGTSFFQQGKNPNFKAFEANEAFQRAAGSYLPNKLSRDEGWRYDLHYLAGEIERLHVHPYHATSAAAFEQKVSDINRRIPELSDRQVVFAFMQLLGTLGNGHNLIVPAFGEKGSFNQLPMQFYWFSDGLYIVDAQEPYAHLMGSKVTRFGETPAEKALDLVGAINARDNRALAVGMEASVWSVVAIVVAIVAIIVYTLAGFFLVPALVAHFGEKQIEEATGRDATIADVRFNPYLLSLEVDGFGFTDTDGETLASFDHLLIDFQLSSLFRWALTFKTFQVDGPYLLYERFDAGDSRLARLLADLGAGARPFGIAAEQPLPETLTLGAGGRDVLVTRGGGHGRRLQPMPDTAPPGLLPAQR